MDEFQELQELEELDRLERMAAQEPQTQSWGSWAGDRLIDVGTGLVDLGLQGADVAGDLVSDTYNLASGSDAPLSDTTKMVSLAAREEPARTALEVAKAAGSVLGPGLALRGAAPLLGAIGSVPGRAATQLGIESAASTIGTLTPQYVMAPFSESIDAPTIGQAAETFAGDMLGNVVVGGASRAANTGTAFIGNRIATLGEGIGAAARQEADPNRLYAAAMSPGRDRLIKNPYAQGELTPISQVIADLRASDPNIFAGTQTVDDVYQRLQGTARERGSELSKLVASGDATVTPNNVRGMLESSAGNPVADVQGTMTDAAGRMVRRHDRQQNRLFLEQDLPKADYLESPISNADLSLMRQGYANNVAKFSSRGRDGTTPEAVIAQEMYGKLADAQRGAVAPGSLDNYDRLNREVAASLNLLPEAGLNIGKTNQGSILNLVQRMITPGNLGGDLAVASASRGGLRPGSAWMLDNVVGGALRGGGRAMERGGDFLNYGAPEGAPPLGSPMMAGVAALPDPQDLIAQEQHQISMTEAPRDIDAIKANREAYTLRFHGMVGAWGRARLAEGNNPTVIQQQQSLLEQSWMDMLESDPSSAAHAMGQIDAMLPGFFQRHKYRSTWNGRLYDPQDQEAYRSELMVRRQSTGDLASYTRAISALNDGGRYSG